MERVAKSVRLSLQHRGRKQGLLRRKLLRNDLRQRGTASIHRDNPALAVEEKCRRDALDAVPGRELVGPTLAVEVLRPGQTLLLDEAGQRIAILVEADSDDLESTVVKLLIRGLDVGELGDAGTAPCGPVRFQVRRPCCR